MYMPGNIVIAAAGNLEHEQLVGLLERAARRRRRRQGAAGAPAARARSRRPGVRFQRKDTEQYHVCIGAPGISRSDRRRFAASILDAILGGSASSRLFQEIREKRGMAYAVYTFASQYTDTGLIGIYVGTREENLAACARDRGRADRRHRRRATCAPDELAAREGEPEGARSMLSMESTSNRMSRLGKSLITDTELLSLDRIMAEIDAVEPTASPSSRRVLLAPERLSAAGIGPSEARFSRRASGG